nr:LuxR C-terminal-related transcriptional regulator [Hephaestia sp. MAHUQ-44]
MRLTTPQAARRHGAPFTVPWRGQGETSEQQMADVLAALVAAIGTEAFPARFLDAMRALAGVDLCSVFLRQRDGTLRLLLAEGACPGLADFPIHASLDYADGLWRSDHQLARLSRSATKRPVVVRRSAAEIADPAYRAACYERADIAERLSIFRRGPPALFANGYRTARRDPFSAAEIERLERHAGLLMAAVERHEHVMAGVGDMFSEAALAQLLMALHCNLSAREAEISAAMMLGETQDEIARRKQLSYGSVVTYRRRAYGKLGIASRRDLLRLHRRLMAGVAPSRD